MLAAPIETLIRSLVVAVMNGFVYFCEHPRVREACEQAARALGEYLWEHRGFAFSLREGLILVEGKPYYDLSLSANRLIRVLGEKGCGLVTFAPGVTADDIKALVEILIDKKVTTVKEANARLEQAGVQERIVLLEAVAADDEAPDIEKLPIDDQALSREAYSKAMCALQDVMVELRRERKVSFKALRDASHQIAENMRVKRVPFIALTAFKNYDAYTFHHSVNVCIYTTALADSFAVNLKEVVGVSEAALLHDIGKILVAEEILYKSGRLTDAEWEIMRQHPSLGAKMLLAAGEVPDLAVNVTYGHHLRYDFSGYPKTDREISVDPITRLVNVIDVYEALTAARPYKAPLSPEEAAEVLLDGVGKEFDPLCVDAFLHFFGVFPLGTRVLLSDGSEGEVVAVNPGDPFRPRVRIWREPDGSDAKPRRVVNTAAKRSDGTYRMSVVRSLPMESVAERVPQASTRGT